MKFYSRTEHLIESFYLSRSKNVHVGMFSIYIDDSGTDPNQVAAVAAGWIGKTPSWVALEKEWLKVEADYNFSSMHMAEFVAGAEGSEFEHWGLATKEIVFEKLGNLVIGNALKGFSMAVIKKDFDEIVPSELRISGHTNHYTYAVRSVMGLIHNWRVQQGICDAEHPIEYIFDHMDKNDPRRLEIENVFATIGTEAENLVNYGLKTDGFDFKRRTTLPPLQAADMFAWTIYRAMKHETKVQNANKLAKLAVKKFCQCKPGLVDGGYNERKHLVKWVKSKGLCPLVSS
ncbi:MAG: DUF3800 domain-containing protein [Candidatus Acidiferrales bacterium]